MVIVVAALVTGSVACACYAAEQTPEIAMQAAVPCELSLSYDEASRTLEWRDAKHGLLLAATLAKGQSGSLDKKSGTFTLALPDHQGGCSVRMEGNSLVMKAAGGVSLQFDSRLEGGKAAPCFAKSQKAEDKTVLVTRMGPAEIPGAKSLFAPERDLLLTVAEASDVEWKLDKTWKVPLSGDARITLVPDYYRKELNVPYYVPFKKRSFWKAPPIVALTWYSLGIKSPQTFEVIKPEVDWCAENLLPHAEDFVFQLDDRYNWRDDEMLRKISDYIRSKGLIPGIWLTPFSFGPHEAFLEHPEWFLRQEDGMPLRTFSGINWKWSRAFGRNNTGRGNTGISGVMDVSQEAVVKKYLIPGWEKASKTWNYDYFKIDGMKPTLNVYRQVYGPDKGLEIWREGLSIGRGVLGPDKFINGCNQTPAEGVGIFDGSRTGADALDPKVKRNPSSIVFAWNYLNNYTLWCDADAVIMQHRRGPENVRYHSLSRAMTGQQFITDDHWSKMTPENMYIWQRCFPGLDIYPVNLYPMEIGEAGRYDLVDLRIAKPWGTYDVVALLNRSYRHEGTRIMKLSRLPLQGSKFHVYDYWDGKYLGVQGLDYAWTGELGAHEAKLFAIVPAAEDDRPTLISTSRHFSQGGLDIENLDYNRSSNGWTVAGESSHLVKGDPYEMVFATPDKIGVQADAGRLDVSVKKEEGITRVRFVPKESGHLKWNVKFTKSNE